MQTKFDMIKGKFWESKRTQDVQIKKKIKEVGEEWRQIGRVHALYAGDLGSILIQQDDPEHSRSDLWAPTPHKKQEQRMEGVEPYGKL